MRRKGVAQLVGVNVAVQPLLNAPLRKALLHVTRRDPLAEFRQEQRIFVGAKQPAQVKPVLNPGNRIAANVPGCVCLNSSTST